MNTTFKIAGAAAIGFLAAWWFFSDEEDRREAHDHAGAEAETVWTCSMHPQVRQPDPGSCPICGMDLITVASDGDEGADGGELPRLQLSDRAASLMELQVAPVQRREAIATLRLPGRIATDETRLTMVTAWFAGRVDRLFADYTGTRVREGEHLLELYSPQLYAAQEEYLQALRASGQRDDDASRQLAANARERLRLFGLNDAQMAELESADGPTTHLIYYSPANGVVLERFVTRGQYVDTGAPLYSLADLSTVWVELEANESELGLLRYGQTLTVETQAFPGEEFVGRVAFIDQRIDPIKRTARVRANLVNEGYRLKPGMLAVGSVEARIGEGGVLPEVELEGRWISPMHPEIVKDQPGACEICGMDLVPAESLGYFASGAASGTDPLLIPSTAPLFTGKRSLVYVRVADQERPTFEAREVTLGSLVGDAYPVFDGLSEGELVVVHGQFKIDSELQIRGRPSMMAPAPIEPEAISDPSDPREELQRADFADTIDASFAEELEPLVGGYLGYVEALAADDEGSSRRGLEAMQRALVDIGQHRMDGEAHMIWMRQYGNLETELAKFLEASGLDGLRGGVQALTHAVEYIHLNFGAGRLPPLRRAFCPMVNGDQIGTWLQRGDTISNPYWGEAMLRCGEIYGELGPQRNR